MQRALGNLETSGCIWRRRARVSTITFLVSVFAIFSGSSNAEPAVHPQEVSDQVHDALLRIQSNLGYGVDGEVETSIAADVETFAGSFCTTSPDRKSLCDHTLFDTEVLTNTLVSYLSDLSRMPESVNTVASRLTSLSGGSMMAAGWPINASNQIGIVDVPKKLQNSSVRVVTATGPVLLGFNLKRLYFKPGKYSVLFAAGSTDAKTLELTVHPRQIAVFNGGAEESVQEGRIDASLVNFCNMPISSMQPESLVPFNWGRAPVGSQQSRLQHMVAAASQQGVEILIDDKSGRCVETCKNGLAIAFAQALAIWRSGCIPCNRNALAVVKIGSMVWLDMRAVQRMHSLTSLNTNSVDLDLSHALIEEATQYFATPSIGVPVASIVGYQQINKDRELVNNICARTSNDVTWLDIARGFLCVGAKPSVHLRPVFSIFNGSTDCGEKAIACGKPGAEVQLALQEYAYRIPRPTGDVLLNNRVGAETLDIGPIVLHEVGHWFGIPHPESVGIRAPDVMQGTFSAADTCIRRETLTLLNNAADDRWEFSARGNLGLLPPRH